MRDAVIVSTARTAIGRAYKGGFNDTKGPTLGAYSLKPAVERAGIDAGEVDDVLWGSALQQGAQAGNLARQVALRAGCPIGTSGMTIDRQCSSGLMSIATAAKHAGAIAVTANAAANTTSTNASMARPRGRQLLRVARRARRLSLGSRRDRPAVDHLPSALPSTNKSTMRFHHSSLLS